MPQKPGDLLTLDELLANLGEVLQGMDGEAVASLYNQVCSDQVEYDGDGFWRQLPMEDE